jgi:hypothetical protein
VIGLDEPDSLLHVGDWRLARIELSAKFVIARSRKYGAGLQTAGQPIPCTGSGAQTKTTRRFAPPGMFGDMYCDRCRRQSIECQLSGGKEVDDHE